MVGYATLYTMAPVFSLVLDRDVNEDVALLYPELYKELTKVIAVPRLPFPCALMRPTVGRPQVFTDTRVLPGSLAGAQPLVQDLFHLADDLALSR